MRKERECMMERTCGGWAAEWFNQGMVKRTEGSLNRTCRAVTEGILEEYNMWEVLFSFHLLVAQAILFIVVPVLGPITPPKRIFGITT
ncbi:hypothetical protein E2C01_048008 [Portunus trituberculatus]|uniref:Uncharacterized protein n=1 Tax=Portunus trituberculatus TaxID=210409 RepID=A0A5B7G2J7_PORTR|nr:hypothetical protein [Portunus trituberculatus]